MTTPGVPVRLPDGRGYDVVIGSGLLDSLGETLKALTPDAPGRAAFVVIDAGLPDATVGTALSALDRAGFTTHSFTLDPTEEVKSLTTLEAICAAMADSGHERGRPVVALGGGIVGDVAGFCAHSFARGCPVLQCPTTLLSMVDASVGGKTGVNLGAKRGLIKNMVGAFHQPLGVIADVDVLSSLDPRDFRCGLGECVKHAMLSGPVGDPDLMAWTEESLDAILDLDRAALVELVTRNVRVKAGVVEADETETGSGDVSRHLLNLGHTFAHALESVRTLSPAADAGQAPLRHGEAVSLGLVAACAASANLGRAGDTDADRVRSLLNRCGLPVTVGGLPDTDRMLELMAADKKVRGGAIPLILPVGNARTAMVGDPGRGAIEAGFEAIRA